MHKSKIKIDNCEYTLIRINTLIIGSGAAGLNAAIQLFERGIEDIAILTEKWGGGTSNNAGSDKQTYYRLAVDGPEGDNVSDMARDLSRGGAMHGDIALVEAVHSLQAFHHLVASGVPFPHDKYGRYPGYITDHDNKGRGTSAGPFTSKFMFQALAKKIVNYQIPIIDRHQTVKLLYQENGENERTVIGALALDLNQTHKGYESIVIVQSTSLILATGGPGALYKASVYPESQRGSMGLALEIGAKACNLTETQFGISSVKYRWNLSGSYQQVVPRYFSLDEYDVEHEFLNDYFPDQRALSKAIFLKGYQWPFDPAKLHGDSSSLIDVLVHREKYILKRRVFIDYRKNPILSSGHELDLFSNADEVVRRHLANSGVDSFTPYDRLSQMNQPAIDLYRKNGINLKDSPLEIDVCAQHSNGGLKGSIWWESNIKNLFPIGEVNGTHGVYRPGGSALNAGQVGGIRAAMFISSLYSQNKLKQFAFIENIDSQLKNTKREMSQWMSNGDKFNLDNELEDLQVRMSSVAGIFRSISKCEEALKQSRNQFSHVIKAKGLSADSLPGTFYLKDHLICQITILESIIEYLKKGGGSRGSYLVLGENGNKYLPWDEAKRYSIDPEDGFTRENQLHAEWKGRAVVLNWIKTNDIPSEFEWFETSWKNYREQKTIRR